MSKPSNEGTSTIDDVIYKDDIELKEPKDYKVLLHNDNYTPMEFVVGILVNVFNKNHAEATQVMLQVHNKGVGICGIFTHEVSETKVITVHELAEKNKFPLRASIEEN